MTQKELTTNDAGVTLQDAVAAARSGRRDDAARLLRQVVADDPFIADAWVWLGGVSTDPHEQRSALEHALTIAPNDERAQRGLAWLRQQHPNVFEAPAAPAAGPATAGAMSGFASTDSATRSSAAPPEAERTASGYAVPAREQEPRSAAIYDAPTLAMPAVQRAQPDAAAAPQPFQTERMPVQPAAPLGAGTTDRMQTVPPAYAEPTETMVERRSPFANIARWLIILLYLPSFGAVATLAAFTLWDRDAFVQAANGQLAVFGMELAPATLATTYWSTAAVLIAIAVVDLMIILGFLFRSRVAWWLNLLLATLALVGAITLMIPGFALPLSLVGPFSLNNGVVQALGGLTAFTALFWLLSLGSRRAFYPRRVVQYNER